jgi:hypothetical protein
MKINLIEKFVVCNRLFSLILEYIVTNYVCDYRRGMV